MQRETVQIRPDGREWLAFSFAKPADWHTLDIPAEPMDFEDPRSFLAVLVCAASWGGAVFSVGARPAYGDGTVRQWVEFLCEGEEMDAASIREARVGELSGWVMDGLQSAGGLAMRTRSYFVEDGGRLYVLGLMAADSIWQSLEPMLQNIVASFAPAESHGQSVELGSLERAAA